MNNSTTDPQSLVSRKNLGTTVNDTSAVPRVFFGITAHVPGPGP